MFSRAPLRLCTTAAPQLAGRRTLTTCIRNKSSTSCSRFQQKAWRKPQSLYAQQIPRRQASNLAEAFRDEWKKRPWLLSLNGGFIALVLGIGGVLVYYEYKNIVKKYENFPEDVRVRVTRGLYFMDEVPDFAKSMKSFVKAVQLAEQHGMDPLGDEVFLIKWYMVMLCEKVGEIPQAIVILNQEKQHCLDWIEEHGDDPENTLRRARLLSRAVDFSTRMAELYTSPYVGDAQKSEESLVWSLETTLKERQRLEKAGWPDEGPYFSDDQLEGQLEALGHIYEEQNKFYFASQLFLKALEVKSKHDCHSVILMNNVAAAMVQSSPPVQPGTPPASREQMRESGRAWARQALALAAKIEPPARTQECDIGCAVATHNLAEFAEMDGNIHEARDKYQEAGSLAHAIGFEEGVTNADEGLRRLRGEKPKLTWFW